MTLQPSNRIVVKTYRQNWICMAMLYHSIQLLASISVFISSVKWTLLTVKGSEPLYLIFNMEINISTSINIISRNCGFQFWLTQTQKHTQHLACNKIQTILKYIDAIYIHDITRQTVPNCNNSISKKSAQEDCIYSGFDSVNVRFLAF